MQNSNNSEDSDNIRDEKIRSDHEFDDAPSEAPNNENTEDVLNSAQHNMNNSKWEDSDKTWEDSDEAWSDESELEDTTHINKSEDENLNNTRSEDIIHDHLGDEEYYREQEKNYLTLVKNGIEKDHGVTLSDSAARIILYALVISRDDIPNNSEKIRISPTHLFQALTLLKPSPGHPVKIITGFVKEAKKFIPEVSTTTQSKISLADFENYNLNVTILPNEKKLLDALQHFLGSYHQLTAPYLLAGLFKYTLDDPQFNDFILLDSYIHTFITLIKKHLPSKHAQFTAYFEPILLELKTRSSKQKLASVNDASIPLSSSLKVNTQDNIISLLHREINQHYELNTTISLLQSIFNALLFCFEEEEQYPNDVYHLRITQNHFLCAVVNHNKEFQFETQFPNKFIPTLVESNSHLDSKTIIHSDSERANSFILKELSISKLFKLLDPAVAIAKQTDLHLLDIHHVLAPILAYPDVITVTPEMYGQFLKLIELYHPSELTIFQNYFTANLKKTTAGKSEKAKKLEVEKEKNIPFNNINKLTGNIHSFHRDSSELGGSTEQYASAIAKVFQNAKEESGSDKTGSKDFCFALFGVWGSGKTTLINKVQEKLQNTEPVIFNAWKYPKRPEVWVHLYETIKKKAQGDSLLQRLSFSLRSNLAKDHGVPLLLSAALILLFSSLIWLIPRALDLPEFKGQAASPFWVWVYKGRFAVATTVTLIVSLIPLYGMFKYFHRVTENFVPKLKLYFRLPDHAAELGMQATIGEDLKHLLVTWTAPTSFKDRIFYYLALTFITFAFGIHLYKSSEGLALWVILILILILGLITVTAIKLARQKEQSEYPEQIHLIIDDLDRCPPEEMLSIVESLRVFLDDPEISQRLQVSMLIDREILAHAIVRKYRKLIACDKNRLKESSLVQEQLDKFFLLTFELPALASTDLKSIYETIVGLPEDETLSQKTNTSNTSDPTKTPLHKTPALQKTTDYEVKKDNIRNPTKENEPFSETGIKTIPTDKNILKQGATPKKVKQKTVKNELSDLVEPVQLTPDEITQLTQLISDTHNTTPWTPRSIRQLTMRYYLMRILADELKQPNIRPILIEALSQHHRNEKLTTDNSVAIDIVHSVLGEHKKGQVLMS